MSVKALEKKLPKGCTRETLVKTVDVAMEELGAGNLTMKILRRKCEAEYGGDFKEFKDLLDDIIVNHFQDPAAQKELKKAAKAAEAKKNAGGVGKSKRSSKTSQDEAPTKKQKKEKQEGEPKRAVTSFFFFSNEKRPEITKELFPEGKIKIAEVAAKIGQLWKALSEEDKKPYEELAAKDKVRYEDEMKVFVANGGERPGAKKSEKTEKSGKKEKKEKKEGEPKRAVTAYFYFTNEKRAEVTKELFPEGAKIKVAEVSTKIGQLWKALSDDDKKPYEELAAKDKIRHAEEMKAFKAAEAAADESGSSSSDEDA